MDQPVIQDEWTRIKERLKQRWAGLTDEDLQYAGRQDELLERIRRRTGQSADAVQQVIREYRQALAAESADPDDEEPSIH